MRRASIMLPSSLSIIKVSAHQKGKSFEDRGKNVADAAAKQPAGSVTTQGLVRDEQDNVKDFDTDEI